MKNKIRILIADDHMLLRIGLTSFISGKDDLQCVVCRKQHPIAHREHLVEI